MLTPSGDLREWKLLSASRHGNEKFYDAKLSNARSDYATMNDYSVLYSSSERRHPRQIDQSSMERSSSSWFLSPAVDSFISSSSSSCRRWNLPWPSGSPAVLHLQSSKCTPTFEACSARWRFVLSLPSHFLFLLVGSIFHFPSKLFSYFLPVGSIAYFPLAPFPITSYHFVSPKWNKFIVSAQVILLVGIGRHRANYKRQNRKLSPISIHELQVWGNEIHLWMSKWINVLHEWARAHCR